jgi:hypothetical protein
MCFDSTLLRHSFILLCSLKLWDDVRYFVVACRCQVLFVSVVHVNTSTTGQAMPDFHSSSPCQLQFVDLFALALECGAPWIIPR